MVRLTEVNGLSLPETEADVVRYAGEPGQTVTHISVLPRTITASGDVYDKTGTQISYLAKVLSLPGRMTVVSGRNARIIPARCICLIPEKKKGCFCPFTVQFVCDYPYFSDKTEQNVSLFQKEARLKTPFVLPCVFSGRTTEGVVLNRGSISVLPKICLTAQHDAVCEKGILIENKTTNAALKLSCMIKKGETVTVDCENRTVSGSLQGNLLHALSADTQMADFFLAAGRNVLSVTVEDETVPIAVSCYYSCQYGEAIV